MVKHRDSAHFSVRYCLTASPDALEARLKQLADGTMRMACINYLEAVVDKVPDALDYLSQGDRAGGTFEKATRQKAASGDARFTLAYQPHVLSG